MPPSHPRTEDLGAVAGVLAATGEHAASAAEQLLTHLASVGDRAAQAAVDDLVDTAADTLHDLSATCGELALTAHAPATGPESSRARGTGHVREGG